jgi:hypothetical protein
MAFLEHSVRHALGYFVVTDNETDRVLDEGETLMCMHCQFHWKVKPGSGITRGWCWKCGGPTCGKQACEGACLHWEKALELFESGRLLDRSLERIRSL